MKKNTFLKIGAVLLLLILGSGFIYYYFFATWIHTEDFGVYIENTSTEEIKDFLKSKQLDISTPIDVYKVYFYTSFRDSYYAVWFTVDNSQTEQFFSEIPNAYSKQKYCPGLYPNVVGEYITDQTKYYMNEESTEWLVECYKNDTQTTFILLNEKYDEFLYKYSKEQIKKGNFRERN